MRVVGHLCLERRPRLVEAPEVGEGEPLDARVLDGRRPELRRQGDAVVAGRHALLELGAPEVAPHEPEEVLLQAEGIAACLEALAQAERLVVGLGQRDEVEACRGGFDLQLLVTELRGECSRLLVVRERPVPVVLPVVGEPAGRDQRLAHGTPVADLLRQRVGLLVRGTRPLRIARLVEGEDVEAPAAHEQELDLTRAVAGRARAREEGLDVGERLAPAEEIELKASSRLQYRVALGARRRDLQCLGEGRERLVDPGQAAERAGA